MSLGIWGECVHCTLRFLSGCKSHLGKHRCAEEQAPGMRGDPHARAGHHKPAQRREPYSGERSDGPQHQVKPAASIDLQTGGRAAHVTAKAILDTGAPKPVAGSGRVLGAARATGEVRNTRDPSAPSESGRSGSYRPKAKSSAVERESEGIVVPQTLGRARGTNAVNNNAAEGKGPCGDRAGGAGQRERMTGKTGSHDSGGSPREYFEHLGHYRLRGTISGQGKPPGRRPRHAGADGSPVSRVRKIRTHGLNGGLDLLYPHRVV